MASPVTFRFPKQVSNFFGNTRFVELRFLPGREDRLFAA